MATAGDQINRALRLIGVLAEGETPSAETSADALVALNQMLDSWSTERLAVYNTIDQIFTWPANTISRTLGSSGDFIGIRPVTLDDSTYFRDAATGISYGIRSLDQEQYNGIAAKTVTSTYPQVMWVNQDYPNIQITIYPVPTKALEWHFVSTEALDQPATLATVLSFPPGYMRAFAYNLACELAPEFGVEPSAQVLRIAITSKRNLKRINDPGDLMAMPYSLMGNPPRYNIFAGNF